MNDEAGGTGFVVVNGRQMPLPAVTNLETFLQQQGLPPRSVVVELNGDAVAPSEFPKRKVSPGDHLEVVRIVAGG